MFVHHSNYKCISKSQIYIMYVMSIDTHNPPPLRFRCVIEGILKLFTSNSRLLPERTCIQQSDTIPQDIPVNVTGVQLLLGTGCNLQLEIYQICNIIGSSITGNNPFAI